MTFTTTADFLVSCFRGDPAAAERRVSELRWRRGGQRVEIDTNSISEETLSLIQAQAKETNRAIFSKIENFKLLRRNPEGAKIRNLQVLTEALWDYIGQSPHKYLFVTAPDDALVPFVVVDIEYHPPYKDQYGYHAPYTEMDMEALYRDGITKRTIYFRLDDMVGTKRLVSELLEAKDVFLESPEMYEKWEKGEMEIFHEISPLLGQQFLATGFANFESEDRWWKRTAIKSMVRDGRATKVIMDQIGDEDKEENERSRRRDKEATIERLCWGWQRWYKTQAAASLAQKKKLKEEDGDDEDVEIDDDKLGDSSGKEGIVHRPIHPYVQVFSLEYQQFVDIHVSNLKRYEFATNLEAKLVLEPEMKQLVTVLIEGAGHRMEDIVQGKTGGVIVIGTGEPGTGKTLTAEVYSEQIKRPLYVIQCAELGIDPESVETNLTTILRRGQRWGSILLIDEADVYVRARENDLTQNAIVGVFLRLLERFQGVMFLTSNRATAIDDAIMSRAIAHLKYELPDNKRLRMIWEILADNYGVDLFPKELDGLVEDFPGISGRNVKTLLKLATAVGHKTAYKKGEAQELIKGVAPFVDFPKSTEHLRKKK